MLMNFRRLCSLIASGSMYSYSTAASNNGVAYPNQLAADESYPGVLLTVTLCLPVQWLFVPYSIC
jgi:hypothetical protein